MRLSELLSKAGLHDAQITGDSAVMLRDIATDSRNVTPGALFVAVPGTQHNGAQFVPAALKNGAAALLLAERVQLDMPATVPVIRVPSVRAAVAKLAAVFYAPQPEYVVAVTGTDGKTSTADFARQFFTLTGHAAASMGTLGLISPNAAMDDAFPKNNTSPEPVLLHRTLLDLAARNVQHVAIEASSHGLEQLRLDGVRLTAAAFTNLTRDHLDYHGTVEAYMAAKLRLFSHVLASKGTAVVHASDAHAAEVIAAATARGIRVWTYGKAGKELRTVSVQPTAEGLKAELELFGKKHDLTIPLYGAFQLENILAAIGLAAACGIDTEVLVSHITALKGVKGRLERIVTLPNGALCFVDYAHTPAALENILRTLRAHTTGKLHVVFGCGGERDTGKRPEMGKAAVMHADSVIVTDDNPRREDPAAIRAAVMQAARGATEIPDRATAITKAVGGLGKGDVLVVAGKGHEDYQIIGEQKLAFDDAEIIRNAARKL